MYYFMRDVIIYAGEIAIEIRQWLGKYILLFCMDVIT